MKSPKTLFECAVSLFSAFVQNSQRYMKPLLMFIAALFSGGLLCVRTEARCRVVILQVNVGAAAALPVSCEDAAEGGSAWPGTSGPRPGGAWGTGGRQVCATMSTSLFSQPGKF